MNKSVHLAGATLFTFPPGVHVADKGAIIEKTCGYVCDNVGAPEHSCYAFLMSVHQSQNWDTHNTMHCYGESKHICCLQCAMALGLGGGPAC